MFNVYARALRWLCVPQIERRVALLVFVCSLASLAGGLQADDYILHRNLNQHGALEAYTFFPRDAQAAHAQVMTERSTGGMPWWVDEHPRTSYFRPLSSLSLWLDFTSGAPPWWMHLENCLIYAVLVWLAVALYKQLGLTRAGLGLSALFFGLDGAIATSVGWIAGRNTLLASCFGLACVLLHDRARRRGAPPLLAAACVCFALSLSSAELGLCTLGYLAAHALVLDRASVLRRVLALMPYGAVVAMYLANYVIAGYGGTGGGISRDFTGSPLLVLFAWIEAIPVWLATTASLPIASFQLLIADFRLPLLIFSLVVLVLVLPLLGRQSVAEPHGRMFALGAVLSLLPLAVTMPQERLRFFVAFGVYGLLGPWIARDFAATALVPRTVARAMWRLHGVVLPLLFVPSLFSIAGGPGVVGATALDRTLPRGSAPVAIFLNPPAWIVPWFQRAMRAYRGEENPPGYALYAGSQAVDVERTDERSLELRVTRSWFAAPFEVLRDVSRAPFHVGDRIKLPSFDVEVREVDARGVPTRARFTFEHSLDDSELAFLYWKDSKIEPWKPPPVGGHVQLPAAGAF
jgi:hypothetical protein